MVFCMRLDRFLANAGCGSRNEVKQYIRQGRVAVGNDVAADPGRLLSASEKQAVKLDGRPVSWKKYHYLLLHKPAGVITALHDKRHRTIADLIPQNILNCGIVPVGRLDRDATGLLLLTSDGTLCHRLTGPRWEIWKKYSVHISGLPFADDEVARFAGGIRLADGTECRPARLEINGGFQANLVICEGRFHQVKRMMQAMNHRVESLHRVSFGPLVLDKATAPGQYRELSGDEIKNLYEAVSLPVPEL